MKIKLICYVVLQSRIVMVTNGIEKMCEHVFLRRMENMSKTEVQNCRENLFTNTVKPAILYSSETLPLFLGIL